MNLTITDLASRSTKPMAKKFIRGARKDKAEKPSGKKRPPLQDNPRSPKE